MNDRPRTCFRCGKTSNTTLCFNCKFKRGLAHADARMYGVRGENDSGERTELVRLGLDEILMLIEAIDNQRAGTRDDAYSALATKLHNARRRIGEQR